MLLKLKSSDNFLFRYEQRLNHSGILVVPTLAVGVIDYRETGIAATVVAASLVDARLTRDLREKAFVDIYM